MIGARKAHLVVVSNDDTSAWGDPELVVALLAGDPRGAVMTWRKYGPRVFRIVQRALGPGVDAEDLTQDIFLRVFARVHTLKNPDAFGSFVISIALRVLKWQLRQMRVRRILHLADDGQLPDVPAPGLDFEARQALGRLYQVLDTLPAEERTVFVLRYIEGMDLQEIANAVSKSLATVKRRVGRALAKVIDHVHADPLLAAYLQKNGLP